MPWRVLLNGGLIGERKGRDERITYDEIELMKESVCDGCKGLFTLHETGCYEGCKAFQDEWDEGYFDEVKRKTDER